jgi:hypothetical protein
MDSKERYNQTVFLETIKTGKMPKRSGLGARLYLLGGFTKVVSSTLKKNIKLKKYNIEKLRHVSIDGFTNRIEFCRGWYDPHNNSTISYNLKSDKMDRVFTKYLGTYFFETYQSYSYVYFKPDVVINWGELDDDLMKMYPNKCRVDKRGFVYYKHNTYS